MRRSELEHVVRAAAAITGERDVLVIGTASILASIEDGRLPLEAVRSVEADLAFFADPDDRKADLVDGAIGEMSLFHDTFGYYAQGVSVSTAVLPDGWRDRLVVLETGGTGPGRALCLEPHDGVVAKLVAGREKDREYAAALLGDGLVDADRLLERVADLSTVDDAARSRISHWIQAHR